MAASKSTTIEFLPLGAIIKTFSINGVNIVQSFPSQSHYMEPYNPYFGATIGRVANRIKDAQIDSLNGQSYSLAANDGNNSLHGGLKGWDKKIWNGPTPVGQRTVPGVTGPWEGGESVKFTMVSANGEEGYPGEVEVTVIYTAGTETIENGKSATVLAMEYEVKLISGAEATVVNVTNHSYFNLTGEPTIKGTEVKFPSNLYLPLDSGGIPIGHTANYPGIEPNTTCILGAEEPVVDDCFIFDGSPSSTPLDTRSEPLKSCVSSFHPTSGIHLEVLTTEPAFQFYTGAHMNIPEVEGMPARGPRSAFCVEPSRYVNAANVEQWKGMVTLHKGKVYGSRIVFRAWSEKE